MLEDLDAYVVDNRLSASALRFGDWLVEHFGSEIVEFRRAREVSARELDEASGTREALPLGARAEQPTLPDPNAGGALPPEAFRDRGIVTERMRRPSTLVIALLVVLCLLAGALAALFVGRS
jgi:hypothetical protein